MLYCSRDFSVGDAFVGYHEDTIPSIVMQVCNDIEEEEEDLPDETTEDTWEMKVRGQKCQPITRYLSFTILFGLETMHK